MIEALNDVWQKQGVLIGKTFVNLHDDFIPVRVLNITDKPIKLFKSTKACQIEPVKVIQPDEIKESCHSIFNLGESCTIQEIPDHLKTVYEVCKLNLSKDQLTEI
jgi:hypothetical protein